MRAERLELSRLRAQVRRDERQAGARALDQPRVIVHEQVGENRHRVGELVPAVAGGQLAAHVSRSLQSHALHAKREKVEVAQAGHHRALTQAARSVVLRQLLQRLQGLLREVDVLDGEQPAAKRGQRAVVDDGAAGVGHDVSHRRQRPRREQHAVRVMLHLHEVHEHGHERVDGQGDEGLLGRDDEQLAQLVQRHDLSGIVAVRAEPGEDLLQAAAGLARGGDHVLQPAAKATQERLKPRGIVPVTAVLVVLVLVVLVFVVLLLLLLVVVLVQVVVIVGVLAHRLEFLAAHHASAGRRSPARRLDAAGGFFWRPGPGRFFRSPPV